MKVKTSKRRVTAAARRAEALGLRAQGHTLAAIGHRIGVSTARAHQLVTAALDELRTKCCESALLVVSLECQRLDMLFQKAFAEALSGDWRAADVCLKIMERRAKLLGLDTKKPEIHYHKPLTDCTDEELECLSRGETPTLMMGNGQ